jgi:hypothetical protein
VARAVHGACARLLSAAWLGGQTESRGPCQVFSLAIGQKRGALPFLKSISKHFEIDFQTPFPPRHRAAAACSANWTAALRVTSMGPSLLSAPSSLNASVCSSGDAEQSFAVGVSVHDPTLSAADVVADSPLCSARAVSADGRAVTFTCSGVAPDTSAAVSFSLSRGGESRVVHVAASFCASACACACERKLERSSQLLCMCSERSALERRQCPTTTQPPPCPQATPRPCRRSWSCRRAPSGSRRSAMSPTPRLRARLSPLTQSPSLRLASRRKP